MSLDTIETRKGGRQFGTPNLSNDKKALILAKKHLRLFSHNKIAMDENVSRQTVINITPERVSPEVLALSKQKAVIIADEIARVRDKALDRIEEHLDNGTMPASNLSTVYGVLYDKHRLETNQPTTITSEQNSDKVAIAFSNLLKRKRDQGHELPSDNELISLIESACKANNADVESVKARVLSAIDVE